MPTTTMTAVMTSDRTMSSPATGKRRSAAPREDRAVAENPFCTIHPATAMPTPWTPLRR